MALSLSPQDAWAPLPASAWSAEAARHLFRRAGWTALPADVERAVQEGLSATIGRLYPTHPAAFAKPKLIERLEQDAPELGRSAKKDLAPEERRRLQRENQERNRLGVQELGLKWLGYAAEPANTAVAKWTLFLSDVYVVSSDKVRSPTALHRHFEILGTQGFGSAPALSKAVSRSPAMVQYLDLNQSQMKAPNENFARELFELFVLGEGNYTERDIKEAARAFTGYRTQVATGTFNFAPKQHDPGPKTIFGQTGSYSGDDVIDLAYAQPAAATFLPREMAKFYLSETPLPEPYLAALGGAWRKDGFALRALLRRFFGSQLFFAPEFRGTLIKSPIQFYLGLVQDLSLDVAPLPRLTLTPLRQMGQPLFTPPNVRGWVGGRTWINSATLAARRQFVETIFSPLNETALNADEQFELVAARSNGSTRFTVDDEPLAEFAGLGPEEAATVLGRTFLPVAPAEAARESLAKFIAGPAREAKQKPRRLRRAALTLMQSPEYQLC